MCAAFLDFRKAFDSLDHTILLTKLYNLNVLMSFKDYLLDRSHRVKGACCFSGWSSMRRCIPQGSALGPLLFLNDLPSQVTSGLSLQYADDTTIICHALTKDDVASVMNSQLKLIGQWTGANRMRSKWFRVSNQRQISSYPTIILDNVPLNCGI